MNTEFDVARSPWTLMPGLESTVGDQAIHVQNALGREADGVVVLAARAEAANTG